jgi:hypothetical protein
MKKSLLSIFSLALGLAPVAWSADISNLRGQRYCEILLSFEIQKAGPAEKEKNIHFVAPMKVYNTIGVSDCPQNLWQGVNPDQIKKSMDANHVQLNGPRVWTIDGMKSSTLVNPEVVTFNGVKMRQAGVLDLPLRDLLKRPKPYSQFTVARNTTWVFMAGKPVFELIDPKGNVFIMQSYSLQKTQQNEADLPKLGSILKLPKGWQFRTRILTQDYLLTPVNQKAVVTQDNLLNTYQQEVDSQQK